MFLLQKFAGATRSSNFSYLIVSAASPKPKMAIPAMRLTRVIHAGGKRSRHQPTRPLRFSNHVAEAAKTPRKSEREDEPRTMDVGRIPANIAANERIVAGFI